jgi:glyoxylase-like metal-dependent hydrolase (beta-lactamase superfamily II)
MNKILIILLIPFISLSCKGDKKETASSDVKSAIKMYRLNGGTVKVNNLQIFSQGDLYEGQTKQFANSYFVIEHPKGKLVWDTGLPDGLVGKEPFTSPDGNFTVSRKAVARAQLRAIGLDAQEIDYLALSHTHFDHTGSVSSFKNATWLVQKKEYIHAKSEEIQKNNPDQYKAIKDLTKIQIINGDHDVFGDGTVVIKSSPGHTPGHSTLFVDLASGPVLLSGDLYHFNENREGQVVPSFNTSVEETKASMEAFEAFAKTKNATVILQHELQDFSETIMGEFIFLGDAAVLKGDNFIYGVKIDPQMHQLADQVKAKKRDQYDMVPVVVNGVISPKPEGTEGWDNIVTIKEILEINEPTSEGAIKVESTLPLN